MNALNFLQELDGIGIHLEASLSGKLRMTAPRGRVTDERHSQIVNHKPALLAAINLRTRIHQMAKRWQYNTAELTEVINLARVDPKSWQRTVALDEQRFGSGEHRRNPFTLQSRD